MSLSRKLLESLGLESDKVSTIIEAHAETVDALKAQINQYKGDAEKLASVQKDYETAKAELDSLKATGGDWEAKYNEANTALESLKAEIQAKETKTAKESAYRQLLKEAGVSDASIELIVANPNNTNSLELGEDGKLVGVDAESLKSTWKNYLTNTQTQGVNTVVPPTNDSPKKFTAEDIRGMSRDEINKNWDAIKESLKN